MKMTEVYTYPEMNKTVKELLRNSDEPMLMYAAARIEELEKAVPRWIPVTERLPEIDQRAIVCAYDSFYAIWIYSDGKWEDEDGFWQDLDCVTYWMPLPEPPERANDESN